MTVLLRGVDNDHEPDGYEAAVERFRRRWLDEEQLLKVEPPIPLVDGMLFQNSVALLYGPPKTGKSFVALDLALSVSRGTPFLGRQTRPCPVVYVAAEGVGGLPRRVQAWRTRHGPPGAVSWLTCAVNLVDENECTAFTYHAEQHEAGLIVIDTLARCSVGSDENTARDAGFIVDAIDYIKEHTGACVVVVHHTGKDTSKGARGSSAFMGAVDTALELGGDADAMKLAMTAQKDAEEVGPWWLKLLPVDDSVVAVETTGGEAVPQSVWDALDELRRIATDDGIGSTIWEQSCEGMSRATFYRAKKFLVDGGWVANEGTTNRPRYRPIKQEELA